MIQKETINGKVFLAQTTYYVYATEEDYKKGIKTLVTSDEENFLNMKNIAKNQPEDFKYLL